jgi:predicted house-cleaning noncanonical NTP pyrophosphatase (MazG superfamily)
MKIRLQFNHRKSDTLKALDSPYDKKETNQMLKKVISDYMQNENLTTLSELAEIIDRDIDYSAILLLATQQVANAIERKRMIRDVLGFLREDEII